jgi:hypothetical protein
MSHHTYQIPFGLEGSIEVFGENNGIVTFLIDNQTVLSDDQMIADKIGERFRGECMVTNIPCTIKRRIIFTKDIHGPIENIKKLLEAVRRDAMTVISEAERAAA